MNFFCCRHGKDPRLELNHLKSPEFNWSIYVDNDWNIDSNVCSKGDSLSWCNIDYKTTLKISHNKFRDFPIYYTNDTVASFPFPLAEQLPIDAYLVDKRTHFEVSYNKLFANVSNKKLNFEECVEALESTLLESVETFAKNNQRKIMMPIQGGVDTMLVRSVFDKLKVPYQLFDLPDNIPELSKLGTYLQNVFWGFRQIQEQKDVVVATGYNGDEWLLRNPYYAHIILSNRGVNIVEHFDQQQSYMQKWFEHYRKKCSTETIKNDHDLLRMICNDFQIWHLNKTYFFSPLKHEKFLDFIYADTETILAQVRDASLSKKVIEHMNPDLLDQVDREKNSEDPAYFDMRFMKWSRYQHHWFKRTNLYQ